MPSESIRLDRLIANNSTHSRKEIKALVKQGKIHVNGKVVKDSGIKIAPLDVVEVGGVVIALHKFVYYMMNKPAGVLSATRDKHASTVLTLLPKELQRPGLFPAGRLDKDTEGFLLITNDGSFAHRILAPKQKIPKTYHATLNNPFHATELQEAFANGIVIGEGEVTSSAQLQVFSMGPQPQVALTIYEGMFHQVKRMFGQFGLQVTYLKRVQIGGLALDPTLALGEVKTIPMEDLQKIIEI